MPSAELAQLTAYGAELLTACRQEMATLPVTRFGPVNASGRTSAALRVEVSETARGYRLQLFAPSAILTLIYGRKPGKFPPLLSIQQYIIDKGIVPRPGANGRTLSIIPNAQGYSPLAYAFALAIKNKGNTVFQQGPPSKLFANILTPVNITAEIKTRILPLLLLDVQSQIHLALVA